MLHYLQYLVSRTDLTYTICEILRSDCLQPRQFTFANHQMTYICHMHFFSSDSIHTF